MPTVLPWLLVALLAGAAPGATYKGFSVTATKAERKRDFTLYDKSWTGGGGKTTQYAGDGHWLIVVTVKFEGDPSASASSRFVDSDGKAAIPRDGISLLDKTAQASYPPSSWTGKSWNDWDRASEQIKFNTERTKATKQYLFRVPEAFDRQAAFLKLGDQELPLAF